MKRDILDLVNERLEQGAGLGGEESYLLRLAREKGALDTIFNTIREGILVLNADFEINYFNQAAVDLLGLTGDARGQSLQKFVRELDWSTLRAAGQSGAFIRQEIIVSYPEHRNLVVYLVPKQADEENEEADDELRFTVVIHDITEFREQAESEKQSEQLRLLTMLAAGVAHELGNPLNSLNIHLQLMSRILKRVEGEAGEEARELLEVATGEVDRLDTIIRQFLGALRSEAAEMKPLKVDDILRESLQFMNQEIEERNIEVEVNLADSLPLIEGDSTQLKQAFFNVIKNAIQAMPQGGQLALVCDADEDFLKVSFADSGEGISQQSIGRIFNSYKSDRHSGTGLGLFIVEKIIREHGGRLDIASAEGEGTLLSILLPRMGSRIRMIETAVINESET